jgi:hypothetical protein
VIVRALALAAAVGWIGAGALGLAWRATAARADAEAATARAEIAALRAARDAAAQSAASWEHVTARVRESLAACYAERKADRDRDRQAVEQAQAARREADRTLRAWLERYAEATRSAECEAVERMTICEVTP